MTLTDELRRLLDERGVEWKEHKHAMPGSMAIQRETLWGQPTDVASGKSIPHVYHYRATEMGDGRLFLEAQLIAPEQAIAATLGDVPRLPYFWTADDTLHIELPKLPESISVRLPDHRDREVGSARTWRYTRDNETCHMEYCDEWSGDELYPTEAYVCSACSYVTVDGKPNYCPNCGRKVVDE